MKHNINFLLIFISILMLPFYSVGNAYFSYVTDVTQTGSNKWRYDFVMEYWTITGQQPNPCNRLLPGKRCYLSINHLHSAPDQGGGSGSTRVPWKCNIDFSKYETLNQIYSDAINRCGLRLPLSASSTHSGTITTDECVGFFLDTSSAGSYGRMLPGGICGIAPPPAGKCYFSGSNELKLNHGKLNDFEVNDNYKVDSFNVICNQSMSVKIRSNMTDSMINLRPDGSIRSEVKIDNIPANIGTTIKLIANSPKNVTISSLLKTAGPINAGAFNGTVTLILTIP